MTVAGHRMSLLRSSIATAVCGVNIATMNTSAAATEIPAWRSVLRWARSRSRSSAVTSSAREAVDVAAPGTGTTSGLTSYPAAWTAATASSGPAMAGSSRIVARSVARLTLASSTPGVFFRKRSIRLTHDAQVMPSIGRTISIGSRRGSSGGAVVAVMGVPARWAARLHRGDVRRVEGLPGILAEVELAAATAEVVRGALVLGEQVAGRRGDDVDGHPADGIRGAVRARLGHLAVARHRQLLVHGDAPRWT